MCYGVILLSQHILPVLNEVIKPFVKISMTSKITSVGKEPRIKFYEYKDADDKNFVPC